MPKFYRSLAGSAVVDALWVGAVVGVVWFLAGKIAA